MSKGVKSPAPFSGRRWEERTKLEKLKERKQRMLTAVMQRLCSGFICLKGDSVLLFLRRDFQPAVNKQSS